MFVIMGATGNTGRVTAEKLVAAGEKVRVIGRSAERLQPLVQKGAEAFVADAEDAAALARALAGATAVYSMVPPNLAAEDVCAHQLKVGRALALAIEKAGVTHVVNLSSVGAQLAEGAGPVSGLHAVEELLNGVTPANVLHLRPAYFMENHLAFIELIKKMGTTGGLVRSDLPIPMIATRDIGAAAAEALRRRDFTGHQTRELLGERDLTMTQVASIIGRAIGKPGLGYTQFPFMMAKPVLRQMGMSESMAESLHEMAEAINARRMVPLEKRSAANTTPTSIETFVAEEFVPRFQGRRTAAGA